MSLSPPERGILAIRISLGAVWALNLIFVLDPQNSFFSTFAATVGGYDGTSLGGPGFPLFIQAHPMLFSVAVAALTLYLSVAFLLGVTTRLACLVGTVFAILLLVSQFGSTFAIPGGTDVGPMPLYLASYLGLGLGRADRIASLDRLLTARSRGWARWGRIRKPQPG